MKTDRKKLTAKRNSEMVRPTVADRSLSHSNGGTPLITMNKYCWWACYLCGIDQTRKMQAVNLVNIGQLGR